jgi:hypothetical protein
MLELSILILKYSKCENKYTRITCFCRCAWKEQSYFEFSTFFHELVLLLCYVFKDALSSSHHTVSSDTTINEVKMCGRK